MLSRAFCCQPQIAVVQAIIAGHIDPVTGNTLLQHGVRGRVLGHGNIGRLSYVTAVNRTGMAAACRKGSSRPIVLHTHDDARLKSFGRFNMETIRHKR